MSKQSLCLSFQMELDIAFLANVLGNKATTESFLEAAKARKNAINSVFWNGEMGQWFDYRLTNGTICKVFSSCMCLKSQYLILYFSPIFSWFLLISYFQESETWQACNQNQNVYASNFIPLWIDLFHSGLWLSMSTFEHLHKWCAW